MNYQLMKFQKSYKWILVVFVIWPIIDYLLNLKEINLPLLRYLIFTIGALKIFNIYLKSNKNTQNLPVFPKIILSFCLAWLLIRYMMNISEVFIPNRNYVNLKSTISGGILLFLSFYLVNITTPLPFFKKILRLGYYLNILFLLIGIPLFNFFISDINNGAEMFIRLFYLGNVFLFLLFPYQKTSVNLINTFGFLISLLMMLIIARRNVVLFQVSCLFFLALVIIFSNSQILNKRKPLLIISSLLLLISTIIFVVIMQFNFDLFFERTSTGLESRETVIEEFYSDFDSTPIDWYIGRGPFGSFVSLVLATDENKRYGIENGYLQYVLQSGLLFLIPFILLSITAMIYGFFRSKNHLSKVAAILVLVNLIDMIGFGLPFFGLKYLNLLISFGFCFSSRIRNMNDIEIKKIIRL